MMTAGITRKTRSAQMRWASLLLVLMLLISPTAVFAAPALQEIDPDLVGTWESVASREGETVTVSLFDDGFVSGLSTYADNDTEIVYSGSWESTGEDTFVLYIESANGQTQDPAVEFVGLVTRRGLRLPDAPDWGRNGMSLSLIDENPTDFDAAANEPVVEEEIVEEVVEEEEEAPSEGDTGFAGVYATEAMDDGQGGVTIITITLYDDGSMETLSSYESATQTDSSFETGFWVAEDDGSVTITYETVDGQPYDPVVPLNFLVNGDRLNSPTLTSFGEDGLVVWRLAEEAVETGPEVTGTEEITGTETITETEVSPVAGLYTTDPIVNGDGSVAGVLIYLDEAGFAQSLVMAFSGEDAPITRVGEWFDNGDGTITISFDRALLIDSAAESVDVVDLENDETLDFELIEGTLVNPEITFYPVGAPAVDDLSVEGGLGEEVLEEQVAEEVAIAEEEAAAEETLLPDEASAPGVDSEVFTSSMETILAGTSAVLVILEDGTASISITSDALPETVVELGTWEVDESAFTVTLTMSLDATGQPLAEPSVLTFQFDPDTGILTADEYDVDRYGPDLTLEQVQ